MLLYRLTAKLLQQMPRKWQAVAQDGTHVTVANKDSVSEAPPVTATARFFAFSRRHVIIFVAISVIAVACVAAILKYLASRRVHAEEPFILEVGFARFHIAGFDVALMSYSNCTIGPTLFVQPGTPFRLRLVNRLPPNKRFAPSAPNVSAQWPCWRTSEPAAAVPEVGPSSATSAVDPAVYGHHLPSEEARTPFDYANTPHAFRTSNLHFHGLQVRDDTESCCFCRRLTAPSVSPRAAGINARGRRSLP
jgi:hypothetical protein